MTFRATSLAALSLILVLVVVAAVLIQQLDESLVRLNQLTLSRYEDYVLSDGLRQSSDDLTRMVRMYSITGDPKFRQYFDEILAMRNGEAPRPERYFELPWWDMVLATGETPDGAGAAAPLKTLLQGGSFTDEEIALLGEAENHSSDLALLENEIIEIVAAQPASADGEFRLEGSGLEAMQLLHDQEYHQAKELVMRPLAKLSEAVSSKLVNGRKELNGVILDSIWSVLVAMVTATIVGTLVLIFGNRSGGPNRGKAWGLTFLVVLSLIFSIIWILQIHGEQNYIHDHLNRRFNTYLLSDGLRQTSDDLTRMVRLYAVTGEDRYRQYFEEILDIRNGVAPRPARYFEVPYWDFVLASESHQGQPGDAVPFRRLADNVGFTEEEFELLDSSEAMSNELVTLENEVMASVGLRLENEGDGYRLEDEALTTVLKLYGQEYHQARLRVMEPLARLSRRIEESFERENAHSHERIGQFNVALSLSVGLSLLFCALALRAWWRT